MVDWADVLEANGATPATVRRLVAQLRACEAAAIAFCRLLERWGKGDAHPATPGARRAAGRVRPRERESVGVGGIGCGQDEAGVPAVEKAVPQRPKAVDRPQQIRNASRDGVVGTEERRRGILETARRDGSVDVNRLADAKTASACRS